MTTRIRRTHQRWTTPAPLSSQHPPNDVTALSLQPSRCDSVRAIARTLSHRSERGEAVDALGVAGELVGRDVGVVAVLGPLLEGVPVRNELEPRHAEAAGVADPADVHHDDGPRPATSRKVR